MVTQEEIITVKIAKNIEAKNGKIIKIGNTEKRLGALTDEQHKIMREYGINIAKQIGIKLPSSTVKEILQDEEFQKELGLESEFCNEFWYIKREFDVSEYFHLRKDIRDALIEIMIKELKNGIMDHYSKKVYKFPELTKDELEKFIVNYDELAKMLGL